MGDIYQVLTEVLKERITARGVIKSIEVVNFEEAFTNPAKALAKARDPERAKQKKYVKFYVETVDGTRSFSESHTLPAGLDYNGEWIVVDKYALKRSLSNVSNWFARFCNRYKKNPSEGMEVDVAENQLGFLRISVD